MKKMFIVTILFFISVTMFGQDDTLKNKWTASVNADFVSRYIWRGMSLGDSKPNVQPYITFTKGGFSIGTWGSYALGGNYGEVDLFASYKLKAFSFIITDYYTVNETASRMMYFDYSDNTTGHAFEGTLSFDGTKKIPVKIFAATYFYGFDKDTSGNNLYSTYFEAAYSCSIQESQVGISVGFTPQEGLYGNEAGVVHCGISVLRNIKITNDFSLPVQGSLLANPQKENIWFVLAIKL